MQKSEERAFLTTLSDECQALGRAGIRMQDCLSAADTAGFYEALQAMLTRAGAVSRFLWPVDKKDKSRGVYLRSALAIDDSHALRNKELRNCFEHFDERIREWASERPGGDFADRIIAPVAAWPVHSSDTMRLFDPETCKLHFRGKEFAVGPLITGAETIFWGVQGRMAALHAEMLAEGHPGLVKPSSPA